jgi:fumarate reductase subunit D
MPKRILAGTLGVLAILAGLAAATYAIEASQDFRNSNVHFWLAALGELFLCSMAFTALGIGIHLVHFAWTGRENRIHGWMSPVFLGTGMFFPGVVFSLPLTLFCAAHILRKDTQYFDIALEVSVAIGFALAIFCTAWMLWKLRKRKMLSE